MKKALSVAFVLFLAVLTPQVWAQNFEAVAPTGQTLYYQLDNGGAILIGHGADISGALTIPDSVMYEGVTYPVTTISGWTFNNTGITSLTVGASVTWIQEGAFQTSQSLTTVTIPASVTRMDYAAFNDCPAMTQVNYGGTLLQWMDIDFGWYGNPLVYGHHLYIDGQEVTNLVIPEGVTMIKPCVFHGMELGRVTIPSTVDSICENAFRDCSGLARVYCSSLADWCRIGFANEYDNPIYYSRNLYVSSAGGAASRVMNTLTIPEGVTEIKPYAFFRLSNVYTVEMPEGLQRIGHRAFWEWEWNVDYTVPSTVTSIGEYALHGNGTVYYNAVNCSVARYETWNAGAVALPHVGRMIVGEGVQRIPRYLLPYDDYLNVLKLMGSTPPQVADFAFDNMRPRVTIQVPCGLTATYQAAAGWDELENTFQEVPGYDLRIVNSEHGWTSMERDATCTLPARFSAGANEHWHFMRWSDGVTDNPRELTLTQDTVISPIFGPDLYDTLDNGLVLFFTYNGTGLTLEHVYGVISGAVVLPDSVMYEGVMTPVTRIYTWDFNEQRNMTSITIPKGVTFMKEFYECTGLTRVDYGGTLADWCNIEFENWYSNPTLYAHHLYINGEEVLNPVIPEGVAAIRYRTFTGLNTMTTITLPVSLDTVYPEAFDGSDGLVRVNYSGTLADWCNIGFSQNPLEFSHHLYIDGQDVIDVVIPEGVTAVKPGAFRGLSNSRSVVLPEGLQRIGRQAFVDCWPEEGFTIPSTVTYIGEGAIRGDKIYYNATNCTVFESNAFYEGGNIVVGENVQSLPTNFFSDHIWNLKMQGNPPTVPQYALERLRSDCQVKVPCGLLNAYHEAPYWGNLVNLSQAPAFDITFGEAENGRAYVQTEATCTTPAKVYAENNSYYHFVHWTDGNTNNPRNVNLTQDTMFTPVFAIDTYTVALAVRDTVQGWVAFDNNQSLLYAVTRQVLALDTVTLIAQSKPGYHFIRWDDWDENWGDSIRRVVIYGDREYYPQFEAINFCDTLANGYVFCYTYRDGGMKLESVSSDIAGDVVIPDSVMYAGVSYPVIAINNYVFASRNGVTTITLPATIRRIDYEAFCDMQGLMRVNYNGTIAQWCAIDFESYWSNPVVNSGARRLYIDGQEVVDLVIPEGVTSIGRNAFREFNNIATVTLPSTIDTVGCDAFEGCNNLLRINFNGTLADWCRIGFFDDWGSNPLVHCNRFYIGGSRVTNIVIPDEITVIKPCAFQSLNEITSVVIPEGVTTIGRNAFDNMYGTVFTIPSTVTSIGEYAIRGNTVYYNAVNCTQFANNAIPDANIIVVGEGVQSLSPYFFTGNIHTLKMQCDPPTVASYAFDRMWDGAQIQVKCGKMSLYQADATWSSWSNMVETNTYALKFGHADNGSAWVYTEATCLTPVTFYAGGNDHYHFTQWSDGNTDNPREVFLTQDTMFTPEFAIDTYYVVPVVCDNLSERGYVTGGDTVLAGETVHIAAYANPGYYFTGWSDGDGQAVRTVEAWYSREICAYFEMMQFVSGQLYYRYAPDRGMVVSGHNGDIEGHLIIPDTVTFDGVSYPVVGIDSWTLNSQFNMTAVTLPATLDTILNDAFYDNPNLMQVNFNGTMEQWCHIYFHNDWANPTHSGRHLYIDGSEVFALNIPSGVTAIGQYAFTNCTEITSVTLPASLDTVGYGAFQNCSSLGRTRFNGTIGEWCNIGFGGANANPIHLSRNLFLGSSKVTNLTIPAGVTVVKPYVFYSCHSLTSVTFGDDVRRIGEFAFEDCQYLTTVNFAPYLTDIDFAAFRYCNRVTMFDLPDSLRSIASYAFWDCGNASVVIPANVTYISSEALNIGGQLYYNAVNCALLSNNAFPYVNTIVVGEGVQVIPYGLINQNLYTLKMHCVPPAVDNFALDRLRSDATIQVACGLLPLYRANDEWNEHPERLQEGNVYTIRFTSNEHGGAGVDEQATCSTPARVSAWSHEGYHFGGWSDGVIDNPRTITLTQDTLLTPLFFEDFYDTLDNGIVFHYYYNGMGLTLDRAIGELSGAVVIPDSVFYQGQMQPVTEIRTGDFNEKRNMTSITLPKDLKEVYGFYECTGLTRVNFGGTLEQWCNIRFGEWHSNPTRYAHHLYIGGAEVVNPVIPEGVTSIGYTAFIGLNYMRTITLPVSIDTISDAAFEGCDNLTRVNYNGTLADWCGIGFQEASSNPLAYAHNLYIGGTKVTGELVIPEGVTVVKKRAFQGLNNNSVRNVVLPEGLQRIGHYAFVDIWPDDGITIPSTVTYIGEGAIRGDRVYYNATNCTDFENNAFYEGNYIVVGENVQLLPTNFFRSNLWTLRMKGLPPSVEEYALDRMPEGSQVQVPCGLLDIYQTTPVWDSSNLVETNTYTLRFGNTEHGYVNVNMEATCTTPARVSVGANEGYRFIRWADGSTDNPRTIILTQDTILTPIFYADLYDTLASGTIFRYYYNGAGMTLAGINGSLSGAVSIPDSVFYIDQMQPVSAIESWVFGDQWGMTQISLPGTLTQIGYGAFCTGIPTWFRGTMAQWCGLQLYDSGSQPARDNRLYIDGVEVINPVVPEGVTSIGQWAFYALRRITSIILPASLDTIGNGAFESCDNLRRVNYGGTVADWCGIGFANGWNTNPLNYAHSLCIGGQQVTQLVIPAGVTAIKPYVFQGLNSLTSVELPEGLLSIGHDAFGEGNYGMSYTIPSSVVSIGDWAIRTYAPVYYNATNCTSMAYNAFGETSTIVVGSNVQALPTNLFTESVWNLRMQGLPPVVESNAFNRMPEGSHVQVQCGLMSQYQADPMWGTTNLEESNTYALKFGGSQHGHADITTQATCTTPAEVYAYNDMYYHFIGWSDGVTDNPRTITLTQDTMLTPVFAIDTYTVAVEVYDTLQGWVLVNGQKVVNVQALDTLTIEAHAYPGFTFLRWDDWDYDNYNDSVRTVVATYSRTFRPQFEPFNFCDTTSGIITCYRYNGRGMTLQSVNGTINGIYTMPDSVEYEGTLFPVTEIDGWGTFSGQNNMTWITLPKGLTRVRCDAFSGCDNLTRVIWNGTIEQWCQIDFECWTSNPIGYARHLFMDGVEVINPVIPEGITELKRNVFYNLSSIASITLPSTLDTIGDAAFEGCNGLLRTIYNGTVEQWCHIGFANGWNAQPISYSRNLYIGGEVVNNLEIPNGITAIKPYAFEHLSTLHSLQLPEGLLSIGREAFWDCNSGLEVTIPSTVIRIEENAIMSNNTLFYNAVNCGYVANNALPSFTKVFVDDAVQSIPTYLITSEIQHLKMQGLPPSVTGDVLDRLNDNAQVHVPCGLLATYQNTPFWNTTNLVETNTYALKFGALEHGYAGISDEPTCTTPAEVNAWGDWKWHFTQWADGVTDNPRVVNLTQDTVLTPLFAIDTYYVVGNVWPSAEYGVVLGNDTVLADDTVTLVARANSGYHFIGWNDGVSDSIRVIRAEGNWWNDAMFERNQYEVTLAVVDTTPYGSVTGAGTYYYHDNAYLYATSVEGYHFVQWSDGSTANPRYLDVERDTVLTATFAINWYSVIGGTSVTSSNTLDFENASDDASWTLLNGTYLNRWYIGAPDSSSSNRALFISDNGNNNHYEITSESYVIAYRPMNFYAGTYDYSFSWINQGEGGYDYIRVVLLPENAPIDQEDWHLNNLNNLPIGAIVLDNGSPLVNSEWQTQSGQVYFSEPGTYNFAIFWRDDYCCGNNYAAVVDNISFSMQGMLDTTNNERGAVYGSDTVPYLDTVVLTAVPAYGFHFEQWNDNVTDNPRTVVATSNAVYLALFGYDQFNVTLGVDNAEHGSVTGAGSYDYLTEVSVGAQPAYGYHFVRWNDSDTNNPRVMTLTQDTALTAQFARNSYSVAAQANFVERGVTEVSDTAVLYLDSVTASATANYGYHFDQWSDGVTDNPRTSVVSADVVYTAVFDYNQYSVALMVDTAIHGTVSGASDYNYLTSVLISATPAYGYHFTQWNDGVTDNPRTLTLTQDTTFTAQFAKNVYSVTALTANSVMGAAAVSEPTAEYLDSLTLTAIANYGYHFTQWSDGNIDNPRTVQVTADASYTAQFDYNQYTVSLAVDDAIHGTVSGANDYNYLTSVTISATPEYGYHFTQWSDGVTDNPRTLTLTQDTAFTAQFANNIYTVTLAVNDQTLGTVSGAGNYEYLDTVVLTATCIAEHHHFVQWSDGLAVASRTEVVTDDFSLTAIFAIDTHTLVTVVRHGSADGVVDDNTCGTIVGAGLYPYGSVVTLEANASDGFHFAEWDDAERTTDRVVTVTQDTSIACIFTDDVVPSIYMVSVQGARNAVIWRQELEVISYNIYREGNTSGQYELVATIPYYESPMFIDTASRPTTRSYRYKMTAIDVYGYESEFSTVHKTMHLTISQGIGTNWNLVWTEYQGTEYSTYVIYRGTNAGNIEQIDIMPSGGNTTYTDEQAPEGVVYYQVGIMLNSSTKANDVILSNIATNGSEVGISNVDWGNIRIYALEGCIMIEGATDQTAVVYDVTGRKIASRRLTEAGASRITVTSGIYMVKIDNLPARKVVVIK